jgi:hypothetical protein
MGRLALVLSWALAGAGCGTGVALKAGGPPLTVAWSEAAFAPCPGMDAALAQVLAGLSLDHAVMDEATGLAGFSHQTRAVPGLGAMFPDLLADGWRVLLVTPLVTRIGEAPDRLLVVGTRREAALEPMAAPSSGHFEAVLKCAMTATGYAVESLHDDLSRDQTLQYFGSDVGPRGDGLAVTFVHLMFASPQLSEFTLDATGWSLLSGGTPGRLVGPLHYGWQFLSPGFGGASGHVRSTAMAGSGWYPAGDGWRLVLLMDGRAPDDEGVWQRALTLSPSVALERGSPVSIEERETWVWLGRGALPAACGETLRCISARETRGGYFIWSEGDAPYAWVAGAWDSHAVAVKALERARVDLGAGQWMVDGETWTRRFDAEQGAAEPLPAGAPVVSMIRLPPP